MLASIAVGTAICRCCIVQDGQRFLIATTQAGLVVDREFADHAKTGRVRRIYPDRDITTPGRRWRRKRNCMAVRFGRLWKRLI